MFIKVLYPHQQKILEKNPPKRILAWSTSLGKTLALIELANKNSCTPLIICPKSLKQRWMNEQLESIVMTKEEFRRDWKKLPCFNAVIVDEIHHFSGFSQMSKALMGYIWKYKPAFVWGASATPYRSTPWNVFQLARIMGLNWEYTKFREAFFKIQYLGKRMIWMPKTDFVSKTRLVKALSGFCDVVSATDAGMPPEDIFEEETFYLTAEQKRAIKEVGLEETNPVVRYGKEHQIAQGFMKGNEFVPTANFKNEKIPRILELAVEHPSMLIFARYTDQIEAIAIALSHAGHKVYAFTGATKQKDRQEIIDMVAKEEDCILIVQTALGEGWEAPRFDFIVFASLPWSYVDYVQCIGRASRVNVPKRRVYLTLTVQDSIDEDVKEALGRKEDFQIALYKSKK